MERKVWILADTNINAKIPQQEWDTIVDELTTGIKKGTQAEAICSAVKQAGQILQQHFSFNKDDQDELHNLIIR